MNSRTNIILISFLGIINAAFLAAYGYMIYEISAEQGRTEKALAGLETELKRESSLGGLSRLLYETSAEQKTINRYFVDIKGTAGFLGVLRDMGDDAGVDFRLSSVEVEGKNILRINFSANGSFSGIHTLTSLLQETPYPISISSLTLNRVNLKEAGKMSNLWSGSYEIKLLSFLNK